MKKAKEQKPDEVTSFLTKGTDEKVIATIAAMQSERQRVFDADLTMPELRVMFSGDQRMGPLVNLIEENSRDLIASKARVGSITASVDKDGCLRIEFVSRHPVIKKEKS